MRKEIKQSSSILQMDDLKCKKRVLRRCVCVLVRGILGAGSSAVYFSGTCWGVENSARSCADS